MVCYCTDSFRKGSLHKAQHILSLDTATTALSRMLAMFKRAYMYCNFAKFFSLYKPQIYSYFIPTVSVQCDDLDLYSVGA